MYIYKTTDIFNAKVYIGQSTLSSKASSNYLGSGIDFKNAIKKYGSKNFIKSILKDDIQTQQELDEAEIFYIKLYQDMVGKNKMYNIANGGNGTGMHTKETKQKLSAWNKGKHCGEKNHMYGKSHTIASLRKISKAGRGKIVSLDTRIKISKALKGRIFSEETKQKISKAIKGEKNHNYGARWMQNGMEAKMIHRDEIKKYLADGWVFGKKVVCRGLAASLSDDNKKGNT